MPRPIEPFELDEAPASERQHPPPPPRPQLPVRPGNAATPVAPTRRPPSAISHELLNGNHESSSLAGTARTATTGVNRRRSMGDAGDCFARCTATELTTALGRRVVPPAGTGASASQREESPSHARRTTASPRLRGSPAARTRRRPPRYSFARKGITPRPQWHDRIPFGPRDPVAIGSPRFRSRSLGRPDDRIRVSRPRCPGHP